MVICLERGADLHTAQLMPLPLTASRFSKIQICSTFLVPAHPGSPGQRAVKRVYVCIQQDGQPVVSCIVHAYFAQAWTQGHLGNCEVSPLLSICVRLSAWPGQASDISLS